MFNSGLQVLSAKERRQDHLQASIGDLAWLSKTSATHRTTVTDLENSATWLGNLLQKFKSDICDNYATKDLPSEEAAHGRCKAAKAFKAGRVTKTPGMAVKSSGKKTKYQEFTMETYKLHGLPDYLESLNPRNHGDIMVLSNDDVSHPYWYTRIVVISMQWL